MPRAALAAIALSVFCIPAALSQETGAAYIVTYFETTPAAAVKARDLTRRLARESRKDPGNVRFEALQRMGQPNHFAILEVWNTKDAQAGHAAAAHTTAFRDKLGSLLRSPYDERPHSALSVTPEGGKSSANAAAPAIYVVTHVDIVPTEKDKGIGLVKELADESRGDPGDLRFDVLQQSSRPNHMTVVEVWANQRALDAHGGLAHTKELREKLTPLSGSLYDERLYRLIQ
jgi:quinol monooxygenase YgiN